MAITNYNETDRLLSKAFGQNWAEDGMQRRTIEELKGVKTLATSVAECKLNQIEALGRAISHAEGNEGLGDMANEIGWLITGIAEEASIGLHMAEVAGQLIRERTAADAAHPQ